MTLFTLIFVREDSTIYIYFIASFYLYILLVNNYDYYLKSLFYIVHKFTNIIQLMHCYILSQSTYDLLKFIQFI